MNIYCIFLMFLSCIFVFSNAFFILLSQQESGEDKRARRMALLAEQGIEIGSFSGGSPLILAGTLEKIVEKLGNWLVSAMRDASM